MFFIPDGNPKYETKLKIESTALRLNPFYVKYYLIYLNFLIHAVIPLIHLVILNTLIYRQVCSHLSYSRTLDTHFLQLSSLHSAEDTPGSMIHQKDVRLAYVSLAIVTVFISCHSVKWVPNIWELRQAELDKVQFRPLAFLFN